MKKNWRVEWNEATGAAENARTKLPVLAADYIAPGAAVATSESTPEQLHEFRLATKHFRYTLEAFRPVYGEALESRLKELREVQQDLGDINDYRVAKQRFATSPGAAGFIEFLDARLAARHTEFLNFWCEHFGTAAQLKNWQQFLGGQPASGHRRQRAHRQPKAL